MKHPNAVNQPKGAEQGTDPPSKHKIRVAAAVREVLWPDPRRVWPAAYFAVGFGWGLIGAGVWWGVGGGGGPGGFLEVGVGGRSDGLGRGYARERFVRGGRLGSLAAGDCLRRELLHFA